VPEPTVPKPQMPIRTSRTFYSFFKFVCAYY
jgi:hypothetical protein